ncbi:hypothetical protein [Faecalitalea cylindroides]|uniref:hypothetical protein n=1 Tax=Faecalitalea cylindroides TaxID=39483 RepID=UPI002E77CE1F|nr:hypothetical protein [Faecalitalea cylindroides]MEE1448568.1 hypothetical protein [Faecalitalea cylindroides]
MTDDKAKYILHEIKSLRRYRTIIREIDEDLRHINQKIESVQEPSCPNGGMDQPKVHSGIDKASIVNSLLSDEMQLLEERNEFAKLKAKAENYYARLKIVCDYTELNFIDAFFRGVPYSRLVSDYGNENPYRKTLSLIKKM